MLKTQIRIGITSIGCMTAAQVLLQDPSSKCASGADNRTILVSDKVNGMIFLKFVKILPPTDLLP